MAKTKSEKWPWPAPKDDGGAKHIIPGTRLPDVALTATRGAAVNLARFQERAIVFIYPFTGTPGEPNPPKWDDIAGAHGQAHLTSGRERRSPWRRTRTAAQSVLRRSAVPALLR